MNWDSGRWAVRICNANPRALAALSQRHTIQIAEDESGLWLCGTFADVDDEEGKQQFQRQLLSLVNAQHYQVTDDRQLVPLGKRLPNGWLPKLEWRSLAESLEFQWPVAGLVGGPVHPVGLTLVRGASCFHHAGTTPELLLCDMTELLSWVVEAPTRRLADLEFAGDAPNRVAVRGTPLPPIMGTRFSVFGTVAIPLGWHWQPAVTPETVNQVFSLAADSLAIWFADNTWQEIPRSLFLPLRRASVRMTAAKIAELRGEPLVT